MDALHSCLCVLCHCPSSQPADLSIVPLTRSSTQATTEKQAGANAKLIEINRHVLHNSMIVSVLEQH
jgi:hypothetical protein